VLEAGLIPAVELDEIETEVDAEAAAAVKFARRSDFPPPEQAYVGLYLDERREPASLELDYA
jgi:TPP-dependent pyruvate/acetoin dehydrogenase alpha subunit